MINGEDPLEKFFRKSGISSGRLGIGQGATGFRLLIFGFILLLALGAFAINTYTDWQWYVHDIQLPAVFTKAFCSKILLWGSAFIVCTFSLTFTMVRALSAVAVYLRVPESLTEKMISELMGFLQQKGKGAALLLSSLVGFLYAGAFFGNYEKLWWFQSATDFGQKDPLFALDLGFYAFRLPWIQILLNFGAVLMILHLLVIAGAYYGMRSLARLAHLELTQPFGPRLIHFLSGLVVIFCGAIQWFARYDFGVAAGPQFTGPGHALAQQLQVHTVLSIVIAVFGLAIIFSGFVRNSYKLWGYGIAGLAVLWILGEIVYPVLVQRLVVEPNKIEIESPYAQKSMQMTRYAYGLDKIDVRDFDVKPFPSRSEIESSRSTLDNMRLWDTTVLQRSIDGLQSLQPYYSFPNVDVDRYRVDGKQSLVMISPRNIDTAGLPQSAQTWVPLRLQYTHGYGFIMCPVNQATNTGQPVFWVKNFEMESHKDIKIKQPRIYFSDYRTASGSFDDPYCIVGTKMSEFDYPTQSGKKTYRWSGGRGVPVGDWLNRSLYSLCFKDGNLLISTNITKESRLLYRRNIFERVRLAYPMLTFDEDPYLVLNNGELYWMLDGYTVNDRLPYSAQVFYRNRPINYIRNSVKIVVSAYTGEVSAYAIDEKDPVLQAYRKIFPGLVKARQDIPKGLEEHFRYPTDIFNIQANALTLYHVTQPEAFLNNQDVWQLPTEYGRGGQGERMVPYYVQNRLPDEDQESFMLILPFTPRKKNNMIGWMAAHCDPDRYGEIVLYRFPKNNQTPGPNQMESIFNQDKIVADINRQFNNEQSQIVPGNLIVVPLGSSILYVKTLFLQNSVSGIQAIPEQKKVILGLKEHVVVADTYQEALKKLFGSSLNSDLDILESASSEQGSQAISAQDKLMGVHEPIHAGKERAKEQVSLVELKKIMKLLDEADKALRDGNFGLYGDLQKEARSRLKFLAR